MLRWETQGKYPVFEMLLADRVCLFPRGIGLNHRMGEALVSHGMSQIVDFRECYREVMICMRRERAKSGAQDEAAVGRRTGAVDGTVS
jgi:hypothetical protein